MKTIKTLLFALIVVFVTVSCSARDLYTHDVNVLPQAAQKIISTHFPNLQISHIKIDKHTFVDDDYDVVLTDGTEIEFDGKGNLEGIDCGRMGKVPDALIPKAILNYAKEHYPNQNIIKYDVKRKGYEIEIQSGLELIFNKQGVFQYLDD